MQWALLDLHLQGVWKKAEHVYVYAGLIRVSDILACTPQLQFKFWCVKEGLFHFDVNCLARIAMDLTR